MKRMGKKAISLLLVLVMSLSLITTSGFGFAAGEDESEDTENVIVETADAEEAAEEEEGLSVQAVEATEPAEAEVQADAEADAETVQVETSDTDTVEDVDALEADAEEIQPEEDEEEALPEETEQESAEPEEQPDEPEDEEPPEEESAVPDEEENALNALIDQTVKVIVYTAATYDSRLINSADITLNGEMPEDASAKAYPVSVDIDDENVLTAYNVTIYDADGNEFQPENDTVQVTVDHSAIQKAISVDADIQVYEFENENADAEEITNVKTADDGVTFDADSASVYAVATEDTMATWTAQSDGVRVTATALESALPENAELSVELYDEDDKEYEAAEDALDLDEDTGMAAMDISFKVNGKEVEPDSPVYLSVNFAAVLPDDADMDTLEVQHLEENGNIEAPVVVAEAGEEINTVTAVAKFAVESFSTFTVTWSESEGGGQPGGQGTNYSYSLTINTYDINEGKIDTDVDEVTMSRSSGEDFDFTAITVDGYTFDHAEVIYNGTTYDNVTAINVVIETSSSGDRPGSTTTSATYTILIYYDGQDSPREITGTNSSVPTITANVYFTANPSVTITAEGNDEDGYQLTATPEHFGGTPVVLTWEETESSDGSAVITETDDGVTIEWTTSAQAGDTVTVKVTAMYTDENGTTQRATDTYVLTYGTVQITIRVSYTSNNRTNYPEGADVTLLDSDGYILATGSTDSNGYVTFDVIPGSYEVEAIYTNNSTAYMGDTTIEVTEEDTVFTLTMTSASNTVDHIDIGILATATLYINGKTLETTVSINEFDFESENMIFQYTYDPDGSQGYFDAKGFMDLSSTEESTGTDSSGETVNQIRIDGTYPVGTYPDEIVYYYLSLTKDVTFTDEDTGQTYTVTMTFTSNFYYWDPANGCPPLQNNTTWQNGGVVTGSGMDFVMTAASSDALVNVEKFVVDTDGNLMDAAGEQFTFELYLDHNYDDTDKHDEMEEYDDFTMTTSEDGLGYYQGFVEVGHYFVVETSWPDQINGKNYLYTIVNIAYVGVEEEEQGERQTGSYIKSEEAIADADTTPVFIFNNVYGEEEPEKTVDVGDGTEVSVGDELTYTINYANNTEKTADVTITDVLDVGLDYVSSDPEGIYDAELHTVTWIIPDVESGVEGSVTLTVTVNENAVTYDKVENTASIQVDHEATVITNTVENPLKPDEKTVDVGDGTTVEVGDTLIYTISYHNDTEDTASITITDTLDDGLDFVSASDGGTYDESTRTVTWTIAGVEADARGEVTLTVQVNEDALSIIDNQAFIAIGDNVTETNIVENPVDVRISISGTKVWDDDDNQDGARPESITIYLLAGSTISTSLTVEPDEDGNWDWSFENLPKYDENGKEIQYRVFETAIGDYSTDYKYNPDSDEYAGYDVVITNTHTPEKTSISVYKVWDDVENHDGLRPDEITVQLYADEVAVEDATVTLSDENNWMDTFDDLDMYEQTDDGKQEIKYTVKEVTSEDDGWSDQYILKDPIQITGSNAFVIVNEHIPNLINLTVYKDWDDEDNQDGIRPESINVSLWKTTSETDEETGDPVEETKLAYTVELNDDNNWTYEFTELSEYEDGKKITYTVTEELPEGEDSLKGYEEPVYGELTLVDVEGGGEGEGYVYSYETTITNTHEPKTTSLTVTKTWNGTGNLPDEIIVHLYANDEEVDDAQLEPTKYGFFDWIIAFFSGTLTSGNDWTYTWDDLPVFKDGEKIVYTVEEEVPYGYTAQVGDLIEEEDGTYSITITNTELTEIEVTKVWKDDDNRDGKRPTSITVNLFADGNPVLDEDGVPVTATVAADTDGEWTYTFTDLPKYDADGKGISYTVTEDAITDDENNTIYTTVIGETTENKDGTYSIEITNTYEPETIDIEVEKTWEDGDNQDGNRPDSIQISLFENDTWKKTVEVKADDDGNWYYKFEDLPKYENGIEIEYHVVEGIVDGYTTTVTSETNEDEDVIIYTFTNTYEPETTSVSVYKVWDDAGDQDGLRPEEITVELLAGGDKTGETLTLDDSNNWIGSFTDLDKYADGEEIIYSVDEVSVDGYVTTIGEIDDTYAIQIVNRHTPETVNVEGSKIWRDNENQDGLRPSYISIYLLKADGEVVAHEYVTKAENWSWSFTDLPKYADGEEIEYTIFEESIDGYTTTYVGDNVINTHIPETVDVEGEKFWDDNGNQAGLRPDSITIHLCADGTEVAETTVTADDDWAYSFDNLPKYADGKEIVYTITEERVEDYTTEINGYDVTNTYTPGKISLPVKKSWDDSDDADGMRPTSVTVELLKNGTKFDTLVLTEEDGWTGEFTDLDEYTDGTKNVYTVEEGKVSGYESTITGNETKGYVITNTHELETVSISGSKTWVDADNQDGIRPNLIKVRLWAVGNEEEIAHANVTAEENWTWSFTDLPKYTNNGDGPEEIGYYITEDVIDGYTTTVDGYDVTNTHTPETVNISGTKTWDDYNNQDGIRPDSITIRLWANDEEIEEVTINAEDDNWSWSFTNLPKYSDGVEIAYTVTEDAVDDYSTEYDGYDVINSYTPEQTSVTVTKVWDDGNNQDGVRPDSITVQLFADGDPTDQTLILDESNGWEGAFTELDMYNDGTEIIYTIDEILEGDNDNYYESEITGSAEKGYVITNSYTPATTSITVYKDWDDSDNQDGKRPKDVTVDLYADGDIVGSAVLSEANTNFLERIIAFFTGAPSGDWTYTWGELPVYKNGEEIKYTVEESSALPDGYESVVEMSQNEEDGSYIFTVTNSYTPETIDIEGSKIWDDNDDQDGIRPDSITIRLWADGAEIDSVTTTAADNWAWSFKDLDKYRDQGIEIVYSITEDKVDGYTTEVSGYGVTNSHTPATTEVSGTKTWDDWGNKYDTRPASITIYLVANGKLYSTETVTEADGWSWSFTDLPMYEDGELIDYQIFEHSIDDYSAVFDGDNITNKYTPDQISVSVAKDWEDGDNQDGIRPGSVTVQLYADNEAVEGATLELSEKNNWKGSFTDLDIYDENGDKITYTVAEAEETYGYTSNVVSVGDDDYAFTIVNNHDPELTDVIGHKTWDDADDQDGKRPESITITLYADGDADENIVSTATVTADDNWTWSFTELPKYNNGEEISYTITENVVEGYDTVIDGYNVTNTHEPELINPEPEPTPEPDPNPEPTPTPGELTVTKIWDDSDNKDGIQPDEVMVQLYADGEPYDDAVTLSEENGWTYIWTDLYRYSEGNEIKYTVAEIEVPDGYTATCEGSVTEGAFTIINTHEPEATVDIPVQKIWDDNDDAYGHRPDYIQVELLADDEETDTILTLSEDNDWYGVFEGLAKYDTNTGEEIVYSVKELSDEALQYYTPKTVWEDDGTCTIINQREYFDIDEEIVVDEDDRDSWVKNESVNEYNAIELEMSTYLPIIETDELANGSFTMNFHEVLDSELILDEVDTDFYVTIAGYRISHEYYTIDTDPDDGCSFHVDVDLTALYLDGIITDEDLLGTTEIMIFFYADLEGTGLNGSYKSTVWYEVYDGDEWQYTSNEDVVEVYTYEISVLKYDATELEGDDYESAALAGATLGLYYDETGEDPVTRNGAPYTEVSGEDGIAMFYGLAEGTYYIIELEAPDGYDLSDQALEVTIPADDMDGYIYETQFANYKVAEKSVNVGDGTEVGVGEELTYTITYYNDNETEADVQIIDTLDDGVDFVSATDGGVYDADAHEVTWTIADVPAYSSGSVDLTVVVNENAKTAAGVENTADVQIEDHAVVTTNPVDNPLKPDDPVDPEKSANVATGSGVAVGDEVTYTITYYNNNNTEADVVITDVLDAGVDFVSATDGGVYDADTHTVTWTISNVAAFTEGSVELTVVVNENAEKTEDIENTAGVKIGNEVSMDTNTVDIPVEPEEPTAPEKSANVDTGASVAVGDDITYTITYYNNYAEATTVVITDVLDAGVDFVTATDGGVYDADTHTVIWTIENAPALTSGSVDLTVTVNGDAARADGVSNTASVQIGNDAAVDTNTVAIPLKETESSTPDNGGNGGNNGNNGGTTGGNNGNNGGTTSGNGGNTGTSKTLPQTGQLNWPIWLFGGLGIIVLALGIVMILTSKKGKREA